MLQIIVNCLVRVGGGIVMLQKPRRGWWVLPGGKVEEQEVWPDAAKREVLEEVGLDVDDLTLRGVHIMDIQGDHEKPPVTRTLIQFTASFAHGNLFTESKEGVVGVISEENLGALPMDEGDKIILKHTLWAEQQEKSPIFYGHFTYTSEHQLLAWRVTPEGVAKDVPLI